MQQTSELENFNLNIFKPQNSHNVQKACLKVKFRKTAGNIEQHNHRSKVKDCNAYQNKAY